MKKIFFIIEWTGSKENTWSGTPNGILNALIQCVGSETVVEEIQITYNRVEKFIRKFIHKVYKLLSIDGCNLIERRLESNIARKKVSPKENGPMIVFAECYTKKQNDTYLYMDCSVDYGYRIKESNEQFAKYVPLARPTKYSLVAKREKEAMEFYRNCKGIFTMGQWLADDLVSQTGLPKEKVHCVGGGCNIALDLIDSSQKEGNKFLFVGKDFDRKGGKLVLNAFQILNQSSGGKYHLYIAGPSKWPLENEIPPNVHFLGLKTTTELAEYYNLCDVFVMPSYFEAYGIVFAEALIYGLPCIGRDAFSMKDFIIDGQNGYLLREDEPNILAKLMERTISDSDIRNHVIEDRQKYIDQYSWKTVAKRILEVFEKDGYSIN